VNNELINEIERWIYRDRISFAKILLIIIVFGQNPSCPHSPSLPILTLIFWQWNAASDHPSFFPYSWSWIDITIRINTEDTCLFGICFSNIDEAIVDAQNAEDK
jgi:hypothetical protein